MRAVGAWPRWKERVSGVLEVLMVGRGGGSRGYCLIRRRARRGEKWEMGTTFKLRIRGNGLSRLVL